jgi:hypothetical protein
VHNSENYAVFSPRESKRLSRSLFIARERQTEIDLFAPRPNKGRGQSEKDLIAGNSPTFAELICEGPPSRPARAWLEILKFLVYAQLD